jgi:hypothetical protein
MGSHLVGEGRPHLTASDPLGALPRRHRLQPHLERRLMVGQRLGDRDEAPQLTQLHEVTIPPTDHVGVMTAISGSALIPDRRIQVPDPRFPTHVAICR